MRTKILAIALSLLALPVMAVTQEQVSNLSTLYNKLSRIYGLQFEARKDNALITIYISGEQIDACKYRKEAPELFAFADKYLAKKKDEIEAEIKAAGGALP